MYNVIQCDSSIHFICDGYGNASFFAVNMNDYMTRFWDEPLSSRLNVLMVCLFYEWALVGMSF